MIDGKISSAFRAITLSPFDSSLDSLPENFISSDFQPYEMGTQAADVASVLPLEKKFEKMLDTVLDYRVYHLITGSFEN